jgi:formate/nitrite transporter FocA (FNT family)
VAWYSFGGFLGNVVAGLIVLGIEYFVVERSRRRRDV